MRMSIVALTTAVGLLAPVAVARAEADWAQVDAAFDRKAIVVGHVHKYGLPRSDLHVTLDGVDIKPALALGGWIAFTPTARGAMMMGDLVLTATEVNAVTQSLLANGVQVTGVHNHLLRASPATFYMHVGAQGDPVKLAGFVRDALAQTGTPPAAPSAAVEPPRLDFDTARIDDALGASGKNNGGVYQFSIARANPITMDGAAIAPAMGVANAINFEPTGDGKAAISGDFVAKSGEIAPLLKALQSGRIEVTAVHNHMLDEEPRLFFVHFWAHDDALKLARALRAGLDVVKPQ